MESKYSVPINSSTQVSNRGKYVSEEVGTIRKNFTFATVALFAIATLASTSSDIREQNTQVETTITANKANYSISVNEHITEINNSLISDSQKLQKEFGFKTAQWAAVLQVERKTLYNWAEKPETKIQGKVLERIETFQAILNDMDTGHAQFLASFSFGRYKDPEIGKELVSKNLSFDKVIGHYERLYSEFDGKYKRAKHKYSMYS